MQLAAGEQGIATSGSGRTGRWQWPAVAALCVGLQVSFLLATSTVVRNTVVLVSAGALVALLLVRRRLRPPVRALGIAIVASILAVSLLNVLFERHLQANPKTGEAFREPIRSEHWPVYGYRKPGRWPHSLAALMACSLLGYWACERGRRMVLNENRASGALLGLCAASGLTMFGLAFAKSRQRWREILPADAMFIEDAAHFRGLSDVMRNYVERMDELSWLGAHYPPGNMLLLASLGLAGKYMVLIAAAASPALLWGAARRMGSSRHAAWWAAALMAAAPFVLMHASISMTTLVVPLSALSLWLGAICVCASPNAVPPIRLIVSAGALGALLVIWSFFTFGVAFHALMLLVLLVLCLLQHHTPWHRAAASVLVAAAVTTVLLALLKLTSGYDTVAALREARANHFEQIGGLKLPPHDPLERTLLRSVGNILAFWTAHLPITAAALLTLGLSKRDRGVLRLIMPAAGITLLVAGFCGTFTLETERIWLFLVPPLALAAGQWLGDRALEDDYETPIWVVVMSICLALVIASTFQPYAG